MKIYRKPGKDLWPEIFSRPDAPALSFDAAEIYSAVKDHGDVAVREFTKKFDGVEPGEFKVSEEEINAAGNRISKRLKDAIRVAEKNITTFHLVQRETIKKVETMPGVYCWRKSVGIDAAGIYIPGGSAPLFSTVLMLCIPARLAKCKRVILCTPPGKNGKINDAILYAAKISGVTEIYKCGGAQAIAAMACGTESIPKADKIFGPGNSFVTAMKMFVFSKGVAIDMPAGPSEVAVLADGTADPEFIAADLLSQAEHGPDSQVILVSDNETIIEETIKLVEKMIEDLDRKEICKLALSNSKAVLCNSLEEGIGMLDLYAPEHLIISCKNEEVLAGKVRNAGSVFLGNYSPESIGDYASGTNHTLPTNGFAKAFSGVSVDSFVKKITFQKVNRTGLENIGSTVEAMAEAEGLSAHKLAVNIRLKKLNDEN